MAEVGDTLYAPDQCGQNAGQSGTATGIPRSEKWAYKPLNLKKDGELGTKLQYRCHAGYPESNKLIQLGELEEENRAPPCEVGGATPVGLKKNDSGSDLSLHDKERHIAVKQVKVLQSNSV